MHRLRPHHGLCALLATALLTVGAADAQTRMGHRDPGKGAAERTPVELRVSRAPSVGVLATRLRTARNLSVRWPDGRVSRNVRIGRLVLRGQARAQGADINIGVGELQECTISKSMDRASTTLAQYAINGNAMPRLRLTGTDAAGRVLEVTLTDVLVSSYQSGGPNRSETVVLHFERITFENAVAARR